ncbi:hypothetical protein PIB30_100317, partial [Stylosanthes scabra]|nr:hypothetical protein [Stylosanthes scabra]
WFGFLYNDILFLKLRNSEPVAKAAARRPSNGAVAGELKHVRLFMVVYPDLLVFDPEIERSLRHIRQVKRRIQFDNTQYSQIEEVFSESDSAYSSASETDIELPSSDSGTSTMGDLPRITLKQMGGASMALENQLVRFLELNENFELKSGLINLLP